MDEIEREIEREIGEMERENKELFNKFKKLAILYLSQTEGNLNDETYKYLNIFDNLDEALNKKRESFYPLFTNINYKTNPITLYKHINNNNNANNSNQRYFIFYDQDDAKSFRFWRRMPKNLYGFSKRNLNFEVLTLEEFSVMSMVSNELPLIIDENLIENLKLIYMLISNQGIYMDCMNHLSIGNYLKIKSPLISHKILSKILKFLKSYAKIKIATGFFPVINMDNVVFDGEDIHWNGLEFAERGKHGDFIFSLSRAYFEKNKQNSKIFKKIEKLEININYNL